MTSLSEQNIIDCAQSGTFTDSKDQVQPEPKYLTMAYSFYANGCHGGNSFAGFLYYKYNGLQTEANYPYTKKVALFI